MYIRELRLDGYGALSDVRLVFETPVTVLYGPNEAGKSTLLRFIRSMLYGFPTRKDPVERGEPANGGRHGGSLVLLDAAGREWLLERYAERGGGLVVRDDTGTELGMGQAEWERRYLGGIPERLFRQLFAVSLDELHELRTLQGEEIGNYLTNAGIAGGAALAAARRKLGTEMDRLYRPKGSTQEINRLLAEIKETEAAIRQSRDAVQSYNAAKQALAEVEDQLAAFERKLPVLRAQAAELQSACEMREWWLKRQALKLEEAETRSALPDPSADLLPEQAEARWTALLQERAAAAAKLGQAQADAAKIAAGREALKWHAELLEALPAIERLEQQREGIAARRDERAELEAERRVLDETVSGIIARISPDWGEGELQAFGGLTADHGVVDRLRHAFEETERASRTLQAELGRTIRAQEVAEAESGEEDETGRQEAGHGFVFALQSRNELRQAWDDLEDELRRYERARADALRTAGSTGANGGMAALPAGSRASRSGTRRAARPAPRAAYAIAAACAAAAVALPATAFTSLNVVLALVLLLVSGAVLLGAYRCRSGTVSAAASAETAAALDYRRKQLGERVERLLLHSHTAAAALLPEATEASVAVDEEVWRQLRSAVYEELDRLERADRLTGRQQERKNRMQALALERTALEREAARLREKDGELQAEWRMWLARTKLPRHLLPDSLPQLLHLAEQGQATLRQRLRTLDRIGTLDRTIGGFEQAAAALLERFPSFATADSAAAVQWLHREALKQQAIREDANRMDAMLAAAQATADEAQLALNEAEKQVQTMLSETQAADEAALALRLRIDDRCRSLRRDIREAQLRLEAGRGPEEVQRLYALLESRDAAALASLLEQAREELEAEEARRAEGLDKRGRLAQELEGLRNDGEPEQRVQRLAELRSGLEALLERYAVLAISDRLMARTKAVFEEERQPEVLKRASGFFRLMTSGAYTRIATSDDSRTVYAETNDRRRLDSAFLSRGTQEQLYLAMRFALCDAASREQPLPLLLDDLFVHFDERRLTNTFPVLAEMASARQVILFTCHRHVAEAAANGLANARVLTLAGREGQAFGRGRGRSGTASRG